MGNSTEPSTDASVLITTEYGPVEGEARQGHIAVLGIPYASHADRFDTFAPSESGAYSSYPRRISGPS